MTNEDAAAELAASLESYYGADERAVRFAIEALRKLQRFEEREPLVQELIDALRSCPNDDALDEMCPKCLGHWDDLRDFELLPPRG